MCSPLTKFYLMNDNNTTITIINGTITTTKSNTINIKFTSKKLTMIMM